MFISRFGESSVEDLVEFIENTLKMDKTLSILDIGCGNGYCLLELVDLLIIVFIL